MEYFTRSIAISRITQRREAAERDAQRARRDGPVALLYRQLEKQLETKFQLKRRGSETPREFVERCFNVEDGLVERNAEDQTNVETNSTKKGFGRRKDKTPDAVEKTQEPTPEATRNLFRELVELYYGSQFGAKQITPQETERWTIALRDALTA